MEYNKKKEIFKRMCLYENTLTPVSIDQRTALNILFKAFV